MTKLAAAQFLDVPANIKSAMVRGGLRILTICGGLPMEKAAKVSGTLAKLEADSINRQVKVANASLEAIEAQAKA